MLCWVQMARRRGTVEHRKALNYGEGRFGSENPEPKSPGANVRVARETGSMLLDMGDCPCRYTSRRRIMPTIGRGREKRVDGACVADATACTSATRLACPRVGRDRCPPVENSAELVAQLMASESATIIPATNAGTPVRRAPLSSCDCATPTAGSSAVVYFRGAKVVAFAAVPL